MITAACVAAIEVFERLERRNVQQFCYAAYDDPDAPPSQYIDYFLILIIRQINYFCAGVVNFYCPFIEIHFPSDLMCR